MRALKNSITVRKLASLSAVGAGALAAIPPADAGTIQYSGIINQTLTANHLWYTGTGGTLALPGSARLGFALYSIHGTALGVAGGNSVFFQQVLLPRASAASFSFLKLVGAGALQPALYGAGGGYFNTFRVNGTHLASGGNGQFTDRFLLFDFKTGPSSYDYGWAQLSMAVSGPPINPVMIIKDYAFDTSGNTIAAGDTGAAVPEPGTLGPTGMAALALGAVGLRRWRAARRQNA